MVDHELAKAYTSHTEARKKVEEKLLSKEGGKGKGKSSF